MNISSRLQTAARKIAALKIANGKTPWLRDVQIRDFIIDYYGKAPIDRVAKRARKRFGTLAPSRAAIGRFYKAVSDEVRNSA